MMFSLFAKIIKKLGLPEECVLMPGFVDNVSNYYLRSKVFCLFSSREGGPMCLLEANSHCLPIICSNVPGNLNYAFNHKNALTFNVHDYKTASILMNKIIEDVSLYNLMANNSLQVANANSFKNTVNQYLEIFNYVKH